MLFSKFSVLLSLPKIRLWQVLMLRLVLTEKCCGLDLKDAVGLGHM